jgi:hypothetical protein
LLAVAGAIHELMTSQLGMVMFGLLVAMRADPMLAGQDLLPEGDPVSRAIAPGELGPDADRVGPRVGYDHRYADDGVEAAPYPRRVIPVTSHARPRALQYKATMTRTKARCSAALWVFARSATARPSCTE